MNPIIQISFCLIGFSFFPVMKRDTSQNIFFPNYVLIEFVLSVDLYYTNFKLLPLNGQVNGVSDASPNY